MPEGQARDEDFSPKWPSCPHDHMNHRIILAFTSNSVEAKLSAWFQIFNYGQYMLLKKWRPATQVVRSLSNAAPFYGRDGSINVTGFHHGEEKVEVALVQCLAITLLTVSECKPEVGTWPSIFCLFFFSPVLSLLLSLLAQTNNSFIR